MTQPCPCPRVTEVMSRIGGRRARLIAVAVTLLLGETTSAIGQAQDVKVIEIQVGDNMHFTPSEIDVHPGQRMRVILKPVGKIQALAHSFVLLREGTAPKDFVDRTSEATKATGVIIPAMMDQVIAATTLVKPGGVGEVTFEAPTQPGEYIFVCTFPGHFNLGMKGRLIVK
jgi:uncharacterized cupredoxin-like copper-binding protein